MESRAQVIANQMIELGKDPSYTKQVIHSCAIILQALRHSSETNSLDMSEPSKPCQPYTIID